MKKIKKPTGQLVLVSVLDLGGSFFQKHNRRRMVFSSPPPRAPQGTMRVGWENSKWFKNFQICVIGFGNCYCFSRRSANCVNRITACQFLKCQISKFIFTEMLSETSRWMHFMTYLLLVLLMGSPS